MNKLLSLFRLIFPKRDDKKEMRLKIIEVINAIKEAAEDPIIKNIARALIGQSSDVLLDSIRKRIPFILKRLNLTQNGFNSNIAIKQTAERLHKVPKGERAGYYKMIAGELYSSYTGLPIDTAIEEVQREYRNG